MEEFSRIQRLPPYVFNITGEMKVDARRRGEDIIDFGMGNPDGATPKHIVDKMIEAALKPVTHRYSVSKGIPRLRKAICNWYKTRYDVDLDPNTEAIVTIGSKEGIAHLCLAILDSRDTVLVPNPELPDPHLRPRDCRSARSERARARLRPIFGASWKDDSAHDAAPQGADRQLSVEPDHAGVELPFLARLVDWPAQYGFHLIHDLAYADLGFDGYKPPSVLQVPGAKDVAVEFFTLVEELQHAGLARRIHGRQPRPGECARAVEELLRLRHVYAHPGGASILALEGPQDCVTEIRENYRNRRDVLVEGLNQAGWIVPLPKATMFVWAKIPEAYRNLGSLEFSKLLLNEAKVAVSPGIGFGDYGDGHVRFSLIENEERTRQALRGIKAMLNKGVLVPSLWLLVLASSLFVHFQISGRGHSTFGCGEGAFARLIQSRLG